MATQSVESNIILNNPIDLSFDLDEVLSFSPEMSKYSGHRITESNASLISKLPTVAIGGVCTVCMEDFGAEFSGEQVVCGHVFHGTCIAKWVSNCNSCPLCRSPCIISTHEQD